MHVSHNPTQSKEERCHSRSKQGRIRLETNKDTYLMFFTWAAPPEARKNPLHRLHVEVPSRYDDWHSTLYVSKPIGNELLRKRHLIYECFGARRMVNTPKATLRVTSQVNTRTQTRFHARWCNEYTHQNIFESALTHASSPLIALFDLFFF